jgi:uncharacterized Tic20 family protein
MVCSIIRSMDNTENNSPVPSTPTPSQPNSGSPIDPSEKNLAILSHALGLCSFIAIIPFAGILAPLILWLLKKDTSPAVAYHAKESLNFQITVAIAAIASFLLAFILIGFVLLAIVAIANFVLIIIAMIKASEGVKYRYPFTLRLVS